MITYDELLELEKELNERIEILREQIHERIKVAREKGDLCNNPDYDKAKEEQRLNEARIDEIRKILNSAEAAISALSDE